MLGSCPDAETVSPSPRGEGRGEGGLLYTHIAVRVHNERASLSLGKVSTEQPATFNRFDLGLWILGFRLHSRPVCPGNTK